MAPLGRWEVLVLLTGIYGHPVWHHMGKTNEDGVANIRGDLKILTAGPEKCVLAGKMGCVSLCTFYFFTKLNQFLSHFLSCFASTLPASPHSLFWSGEESPHLNQAVSTTFVHVGNYTCNLCMNAHNPKAASISIDTEFREPRQQSGGEKMK